MDNASPTTLEELQALMVVLDPSVCDRRFAEYWSTELPTFGGDEPDSTFGVWSWDEARLLVGTCVDDLIIVAREDV